MERQFSLEQLLPNPEGMVAEVRWGYLPVSVWVGQLRISLTKSPVSSILVAQLPFSFDIQGVIMACGDTPEMMGSLE